MYDYSKLKGRIVEKFGTQRNFAEAVGRSTNYMSLVMNGNSFLGQKEIEKWTEILEIPPKEIWDYFFTK